MCRKKRLSAMVAAALILSACSFDDESGSQAEESAKAEALSGNSAPRVFGVPSTAALAGSAYSFKANATDADGDVLAYTATGVPAWISMDPQTGLLTGTPSEADEGVTADIFISVSDGRTSSSLPAFRIAIASAALAPANPVAPSPGNNRPSIGGAPLVSAQAGTDYSFTPSASDVESSTLKFSITNKPSWAAFSSATGTLSGKPASTQAGTYKNIVITVSDGSLTASLAPFSITVTALNGAPSISGTPPASVASGSNYSFTPSASDPDGDALAFSISGKPAWANFSTATGALTGAAQAGSFANIVISVSDGNNTRSLPAFTLDVGGANSGTASLSWTAPSENADGSSYTDLAGYRIHHGTTPDNYSEVIELTGASNTAYAFNQLAKGTHYFAIASYNSAGIESALSDVLSKTVQ